MPEDETHYQNTQYYYQSSQNNQKDTVWCNSTRYIGIDLRCTIGTSKMLLVKWKIFICLFSGNSCLLLHPPPFKLYICFLVKCCQRDIDLSVITLPVKSCQTWKELSCFTVWGGANRFIATTFIRLDLISSPVIFPSYFSLPKQHLPAFRAR